MENLTLWAPVFIAGVGVGALMQSLWPRFWSCRKRPSDPIAVRARVLAGLKENHEQEILREIFQAIEGLRSELNRSLGLVLASTDRLLAQLRDDF